MRLFFAFLFSCFVAGLPVAGGSAMADFDEGLLAYLEADYERATAHWLPLAEAGDADAQFAIGMLHEAGQGSSVDPKSAATWYRRAAKEGHADAQLSLGSLYATGAGVTRDHTEAVRWYRAAAQQGNPQAMYKLAEAYLFGAGVSIDRERSGKLLRSSADLGYGRARVRLEMLKMPLDGERSTIADPASARDNTSSSTDPAPETDADRKPDTSSVEPDAALPFETEDGKGLALSPESPRPEPSGTREIVDRSDWPYAIRLASYESANEAQRRWVVLRDQFPDELGELSVDIRRKELGGDAFHRLEAGPIPNEADAIELCQEIAKSGQYCFPVRR